MRLAESWIGLVKKRCASIGLALVARFHSAWSTKNLLISQIIQSFEEKWRLIKAIEFGSIIQKLPKLKLHFSLFPPHQKSKFTQPQKSHFLLTRAEIWKKSLFQTKTKFKRTHRLRYPKPPYSLQFLFVQSTKS